MSWVGEAFSGCLASRLRKITNPVTFEDGDKYPTAIEPQISNDLVPAGFSGEWQGVMLVNGSCVAFGDSVASCRAIDPSRIQFDQVIQEGTWYCGVQIPGKRAGRARVVLK